MFVTLLSFLTRYWIFSANLKFSSFPLMETKNSVSPLVMAEDSA